MDFLQEFVKLYIEESIADRFTRLARQLGPFRFAFLADRYKQLENLDDKFTFMWNLPEVQEYAKPPEVLPVVKDEDVAERLKTEGNILFKKKDFEGALMIYNIAIAFTPHPELCLSKENLKINTSDVNKFKTLGCCYANRSAVFLTMMDYEKCLRDIDLAFEYGYPDLLKSKLLERKERCLVAQKQMTEDGKLATNIQTAMRKAPVLEKYSDTVPGFSSALQLTYSELEGRHVIATRNIHPGEVLVVEESHCTDFIIKSSELHCSICLVKCNNPLPCPNCQVI
ncbi:hypothetical protein SK128_000179 [Halocaridina rubra]|uniref:Uncharacterized protein n=1 Tax=Halocaridina rubra TaxID=373956 RepID=A0AAN9A5H0_HALRR